MQTCRPDAGVLGLQIHHADPFVTLFSHQTVGVKLRDGGQRGHQLDHHPGRTLIIIDLKHIQTAEASGSSRFSWQSRSARRSDGLRGTKTSFCCRRLLSDDIKPLPLPVLVRLLHTLAEPSVWCQNHQVTPVVGLLVHVRQPGTVLGEACAPPGMMASAGGGACTGSMSPVQRLDLTSPHPSVDDDKVAEKVSCQLPEL